MLNFFRKNTKIIIWVVVIAFIAWGGFAVSLQFQEATRSPGRIFGKEVSYRDYLTAQRTVQIFSPPSPEGNPPDPTQLEAQTWEFLLLSREARRRKIKVEDEEVRQGIARLLGEKEGSRLTPGEYLRWIEAAFHEPPREFENQLRERLRIQKLVREVRNGLKQNQEEEMKKWLLDLIRKAKIEIYKAPSR